MSDIQRIKQLSSWDYHINGIKHSILPLDHEKAAIDALNLIREVFGQEWLENATKDGHLIPTYWMGSFNPIFTSEWLINFSVKLKVLRLMEGFDDLLSRLRNSNEYWGAIGEFELASRMALKGYKIELSPKVGEKKADMKVMTQDGPLYFEVKTLRTSEDEIASKEVQHWGYTLANENGIALYGKVYKKLSEPHRNELKERIEATAEAVKRTGNPQEVIEERVISVLVTPPTYQTLDNRILSWLSEKGLNIGFFGPDYSSVERESRIRRAFNYDKMQLPQDEPGIKVVYPHRFDRLYDLNTLGVIADLFEENVYSQENLVAGVVIDSYLLTQANMIDEVIRESNYILLKQIFFNAIHEHTFLVKNKFTKLSKIKHPEEFFTKPA